MKAVRRRFATQALAPGEYGDAALLAQMPFFLLKPYRMNDLKAQRSTRP